MIDGSTNEIDFRVKLTSKDYRHFNLHCGSKTYIGGALLYFIISLFIILLFANYDGYDPEITRVVLMVAVPGALAVSLLLTLILYLSAVLRSGSVFKTDKLLQQEHNYIINSSGINISMESGTSIVKWDDIYKSNETKSSFMIFLAKNKALIIPKRFLPGDGRKAALRHILRNSLPSKKLRLKRK